MTDFYPNFTDLNNEEKLIKILNPSTPMQIMTVASFIKQSLELREGDPIQSQFCQLNYIYIVKVIFTVLCCLCLF